MQARRSSITAVDVMQQLENDPSWVARRDAKEQDRIRRAQQSRLEQTPILRDLEASGINVSSVWDLVNTSSPYPDALPVLLDHLSGPYDSRILEGIARALAVRDARPIAWDRLICLVHNRSLPKGVTDGIMVALSVMARPSDLHVLLDLIADQAIGGSRVFLVRNLMRSKRPEAREALLRLRDDPDMRTEIATRLKSASSS